MAIDFPASPTIGQIVVVGGTRYIWDGTAWNVISNAVPEAPQDGNLYGRQNAAWEQIIIPDVPDTTTAERRNRFVNPTMRISQDPFLADGTSGFYPVDQWQIVKTGTTGIVLASQVALTTPKKNTSRIRMQVDTPDVTIGAGDIWTVNQQIEGIMLTDLAWGTSEAKPIVIRFGFKGPAGTYTAHVRNAAADRSYNHDFTITGGQAGIDQEIVMVVPGDTSGVWPTGQVLGLIFGIALMSGSNWHGTNDAWVAGNKTGTPQTSNFLAVDNDIAELFDAGFHADPHDTGIPPQWELIPYDEDLAHCQRYYLRVNNPICQHGNRYGTAGLALMDAGLITFPVPMRASPTAVIDTAPTFVNCSALTVTADLGAPFISAALRVTVTAAGAYRVFNGVYTFSARM